MTHIDVSTLTLVVAVIIPLLDGALFKYHAPSWAKGVGHVLLSVTAAGVQVVIDHGGNVVVKDWVATTLVTYVVGVAAYAHILIPTGLAEKVKLWTYDFGVGSNDAPELVNPVTAQPAYPLDATDIGDAH